MKAMLIVLALLALGGCATTGANVAPAHVDTVAQPAPPSSSPSAVDPHMPNLVARAGNSSVRLTAKDCPKEVLQYIPPINADSFHEAQAIIDGKSWVACWLPVPDGVFLMFSDGDQSAIPFENFKDEKGV